MTEKSYFNVTNICKIVKAINYKIKKGYVSYLWRGEGKRSYKARFKKSWFVKIDIRKYSQIFVTKKYINLLLKVHKQTTL